MRKLEKSIADIIKRQLIKKSMTCTSEIIDKNKSKKTNCTNYKKVRKDIMHSIVDTLLMVIYANMDKDDFNRLNKLAGAKKKTLDLLFYNKNLNKKSKLPTPFDELAYLIKKIVKGSISEQDIKRCSGLISKTDIINFEQCADSLSNKIIGTIKTILEIRTVENKTNNMIYNSNRSRVEWIFITIILVLIIAYFFRRKY